MKEHEKLIKHIGRLVKEFNSLFGRYRLSEDLTNQERQRLCQTLMMCAFGLAQDFNELGRAEILDEQHDSNRNSRV